MYSDMSICTRAFSSPNMKWASRLAKSVLPTPVGPAKMKLPVGGLVEVLLGDGGFLRLVELLELRVQLLQVRRPGHGLEADAGAGLVDHVDGLVGQAAAADVAVGQIDGGVEGLVLDLHAVVRLVAVAQAAEDFDRL